MKINHCKLRFAVPRKSTRLYISLTLVACDKVRLYVPTYLPTYLPACLPACQPTYLPTYLPLPTYLR